MSTNFTFPVDTSILPNLSVSVLEELLLEKLLYDFAVDMRNMGEPLEVDDLFSGALYDMGHGKLAHIMDQFSDLHVRAVAAEIFKTVASTHT